jgi:hypothetical protein
LKETVDLSQDRTRCGGGEHDDDEDEEDMEDDEDMEDEGDMEDEEEKKEDDVISTLHTTA